MAAEPYDLTSTTVTRQFGKVPFLKSADARPAGLSVSMVASRSAASVFAGGIICSAAATNAADFRQ
jgi:hypothetical protein